MAGLLRNLWARLIAPDPKRQLERAGVPPVVVIDPDADKAHDLDDPFFDRTVQTRIADVIAHAGQHPKK
ncbi:MAG TPA: hypothetical protein VGM57_16380 [Pseudolabrys sp.]|jgi:hypothetical protein